MKSCELCEEQIDDDKVEFVSYYDLRDVGRVLGNSITAPLDSMDLSRVIRGCKCIPDKSSEGNLATWEVCSACHCRIRVALNGQSEYPPQHY